MKNGLTQIIIMSIKKNLLPALLLQLLLACAVDNNKSVDNNELNNCVVDTTARAKIPNEGIMQGIYRVAHYAGSENLFVGYNSFSNQLECIDLETLQAVKIITLPPEGPTFVAGLMSFYYHNRDSIFLLGSYKLALINDRGEVHFAENINREVRKITGLDFVRYSIYNDPNNNQPIYYNPKDGKLYFAIKSFGNPSTTDYYENPLCARLNLVDMHIETMPLYYPDAFKQTNTYYPLDKPNLLFMSEQIIYSFKHQSDIYRFDLAAGSSERFSCPSAHQVNEVAPLEQARRGDQFAVMQHLSNNPEYKFILFDPFAGYYYRFYYGAYPYPDEPNAGGKRGYLYVSVLDTNFQLRHEEQLSLQYRYFGATATPQGLLIKGTDEEEGYNNYTYFRFVCK